MHSYQVDYLKNDIVGSLKYITPQQRRIPVVSTYKPKAGSSPTFPAHVVDGQYWYESLRNPVLFTEAIAEAVERLESGASDTFVEGGGGSSGTEGGGGSGGSATGNEWIFVECDPHPVLRAFISDTLATIDKACVVVATLIREDFHEREAILRSFAHLFSLGVDINFETSLFQTLRIDDLSPANTLLIKPFGNPLEDGESSDLEVASVKINRANGSVSEALRELRQSVREVAEYRYVYNLPLYPWQRQKCWNENRVHLEHRLGNGHPICRIRLDTQVPTFQADISTSHLRWVPDHLLQGSILFYFIFFTLLLLFKGMSLYQA
jgi:acyl transferase domain-containing protein